LAETIQSSISELVREVRERLSQQVNSQAEQLGKLEQAVQEMREQHRKLEETIQAQLDVLAQFEPPPSPTPAANEGAMDELLGSVRNLITATLPEQVLQVLTEEAEGGDV
jgi:TolA-binding protein